MFSMSKRTNENKEVASWCKTRVTIAIGFPLHIPIMPIGGARKIRLWEAFSTYSLCRPSTCG